MEQGLRKRIFDESISDSVFILKNLIRYRPTY